MFAIRTEACLEHTRVLLLLLLVQLLVLLLVQLLVHTSLLLGDQYRRIQRVTDIVDVLHSYLCCYTTGY